MKRRKQPQVNAKERLAAWAKGKPFHLVGFATAVAGASDEMHGILSTLRRGQFPPRLPAPPSARLLLPLYRKHRRMFDFIGETMGLDASGDFSASALSGNLRAWDRLTIEQRKALLAPVLQSMPPDEVKALLQFPQGFTEAAIEDEINDKQELSELEDAEVGKLMTNPLMHFLMWIWFPCWLEYREFPPTLLRKARQGDIGSLEKLLRIDKSVLLDPRIAQHVHAAFWTNGRVRLKRLSNAIGGFPQGPLSKAKIKRGLAGLISRFAVRCNHPLEEPEIRELFDALAAARGGLRDQELPKSSESFSKAIQRERPTWFKQ